MPQYDPFNLKQSVGNNLVADPTSAQPAQKQAPNVGPTNFWQRIAQVGIGKVNQLDLMKKAQQLGNTAATIGKDIASPFQDVGKQAQKQFKYLSGSTNSQKGQPGSDQILKNQAAMQKMNLSPATKQALSGAPVQTRIQAQDMLVKGAKEADVQAFLNKGKSALASQEKRGAGDVAQIASDVVGGGGGKAALTAGKQIFKGGIKQGAKDVAKTSATTGTAGAVNTAGATIQNNPNASMKEVGKSAAGGLVGGVVLGAGAKVAGELFKAGSQAFLNKIKGASSAPKGGMSDVMTGVQADKVAAVAHTKIDVNQVPSSEKVGVRTPVRPGIKQVSETNKINVRTPQPMSDQQFHSEFNKLNSGYEKETKQLQVSSKLMSPQQAKMASNKLETKYQGKLNDLQDRYHNPQLSASVAPKKIGSTTTPAGKTTGGTPTLSKDSGAVRPTTAAGTSTTPLTKTATKVPSEAYRTPPNVEGAAKTAGSSLKIEKSAVEQGLTKRMEDLPEFSSINKKAQAAKVADLINTDRQKAIDIIEGRANPPDGIHPVAVHNGLVQVARKEGNAELITKLAQSNVNRELSTSGQSLSLAAERDPHNPVEAVRQIMEARSNAAEKRLKQPAEKAVNSEITKMKTIEPKVTKQTWGEFIRSIQC